LPSSLELSEKPRPLRLSNKSTRALACILEPDRDCEEEEEKREGEKREEE